MRGLVATMLVLVPLAARADPPPAFGPTEMPGEIAVNPDVTRLALGAGLNLSPVDPGWQGTIAVMGENREDSLLTQISLAFEIVGTKGAKDAGPTGRVSQVVLNPFSLFGGLGAVRLGAGFDVSYAFHPIGPSAKDATGFGIGGRAGGGLSLHPGVVNIWLLCQYRWLSGDRVGGVFFDLLIGPE